MRTAFPFALLVALAGLAAAQPQVVYIPDQSFSNSCNVVPMSGPWPSSTNPGGEWRYQTQLDAAWIGRAGLITDVAFLSCQTQTLSAPEFEIRMSHTTLSTPVATFATNLPNPVVVYPKGSFTWSAKQQTWSPLGLTIPFSYNGKDNLTIELRYKNGTTTGPSTTNGGCDTKGTDPKAPFRTYTRGPGAYSAATANYVANRYGLKTALYFAVIDITGSGNPSIGGTVSLHLSAPNDAGLPYQVGTSLGTGPIPVDTRQLNLSPDTILIASVSGHLPTIFTSYSGLLDGSGKGTASIHIPRLAVLVGIRLHSAFIVIKVGEPSNIKSISNTFSFTITT